jgi:hypothetical protein
MLAFLVTRISNHGERALREIQKQCKSQRRLHDRIIVLMDFAFNNNLPLRICEEIITKDKFWYMPHVSDFLNKQKTFIGQIKTKLDVQPKSALESRERSASNSLSCASVDREDEEEGDSDSEDDIRLDMDPSQMDEMDVS